MSETRDEHSLRIDETRLGPYEKANQTDPPLAEGTRVGEFLVEKKIGEGAMASVYSAIHPIILKRAAIKVMARELGSDELSFGRFLLEARAVNRICHPHIVDVFGFGRLDDGRCYLMMELLEGETLAERLDRGALQLDDAIPLLDQASEALEATHEHGIIHRDLKPENLFLVAPRAGAPRVKLLDFGIAKLFDSDVRPQRTQIGHYIGTPSYNSPEQARGEALGPPTDVYSLGVIAFEMVTGRRPFEAKSVIEVQSMHLGTPPPSVCGIDASLPPALDQLLSEMLAKDPAARPTTLEVRARLAALRSSQAPRAVENPAREIGEALPRQTKRRRGFWIVAAVLGATVAALVIGLPTRQWAAAVRSASVIAPVVPPQAAARPTLAPPTPSAPPPTPPATPAPTAAAIIAPRQHEHTRAPARHRGAPAAKRGDDYLLDSWGRYR